MSALNWQTEKVVKLRTSHKILKRVERLLKVETVFAGKVHTVQFALRLFRAI